MSTPICSTPTWMRCGECGQIVGASGTSDHHVRGVLAATSADTTTRIVAAMTSEVIAESTRSRHSCGNALGQSAKTLGGIMTDIQSTSAATALDSVPAFSAQVWAAFWASPALSRGMNILADDIVGYWPGDPEPVHGGVHEENRRPAGRRAGPAA